MADCPDNNIDSCEYTNCVNGFELDEDDPTQCVPVGNTGNAPPGWLCQADYYGDSYCDCGCGVFDADDCPNATADVCEYDACGDLPVNPTDNSQCGIPEPEPDAPEPDVGPGPGDPAADIDVDTDRNGVITAADEAGENTFTTARGAVFLANLDDDNNDGQRDGEDNTTNAADLPDLARVLIHQDTNLAATDLVTLRITPGAAAARVRLFVVDGGVPQALTDPGDTSIGLNPEYIAASDVDLRIEATTTRSSNWNGEVTLQLEYADGTGVLSSDSVLLKVSPVILPDNVREPQRLFVMRVQQGAVNPGLWNPLSQELPFGVQLVDVDDQSYGYDRWVQDSMQTGYTLMPDGSATGHEMKVHMQLQRSQGSGLWYLLPEEILGDDVGYVYPGGPNNTSHNYGGNLEIIPPHTGYPFGRVVVGGGNGGSILGYPNSDGMAVNQVNFMNAQGAQGPVVEVSSEWLVVGHVDEIFLVVPDTRVGVQRPWKVVLASPTMARDALLDIQGSGGGGLAVFEGRGQYERTVTGLLNDSELMAYNNAVQTRIDSVRADLESNFGLTDADFIEVPVLYEADYYGALDLAVALNPGIQNMIVADDVLFIPDPEGPGFGGSDVWQQLTSQGLSPLNFQIEFVDVYESYHLLYGEAHCGSNMERGMFPTPWWSTL